MYETRGITTGLCRKSLVISRGAAINPLLASDLERAVRVVKSLPRPSRARIRKSIARTRELRGAQLVVDDISVDAVYMILIVTNRKRLQKPRDEIVLKRLVTNVVNHFEFDPGRARVYVLVTLQYYSFMSQLRRDILRKRKLHHRVRVAEKRGSIDRKRSARRA